MKIKMLVSLGLAAWGATLIAGMIGLSPRTMLAGLALLFAGAPMLLPKKPLPPQEGSAFFAFLIVQHRRAAHQVRTLRSPRILAVTGGAILFVEGFAFLGGGGIGSRAQAEKFPHPCRPATATAALAGPASRGSIRFLGQQAQDGQRREGGDKGKSKHPSRSIYSKAQFDGKQVTAR